jgi:hypothetical protein
LLATEARHLSGRVLCPNHGVRWGHKKMRRKKEPGVEHSVAAITDAVVVDVFLPPRDDWGRRA